MEFLEKRKNPFEVFAEWYDEAQSCGLKEPSAFCLATASADGKPSSRTLLLKGFDESGFCFYTNLGSRKAQELAQNQQIAMLFYWMPLARQVRIEGKVQPVTEAEADTYFASRHPDSRVGAWASQQSAVLESRKTLKDRVKKAEVEHGWNATRPPFWSGFRLLPDYFEFWEEGTYRLHNRRAFIKGESGWNSNLLYP